MNWDDLKVFLAIARAGQILAAARTLNLNHATVARRLSTLEQSLNCTLFVRRTNGCTLTVEGEALIAHAERIESEMLAVSAGVGQTNDHVSGTVRIGAPDGFGVAFLAPRLGRLIDRHPELKVQLVPVPHSFSLSSREADIAITMERPENGRLVARKLVDYQLGLYASKNYLTECGSPNSSAELKTHNLVGYVEDLIYSSSLSFTHEAHKDWQSNFEISSAVGQTEAVRAGAGVGILHRYIARQHKELQPILPQINITRSYWLVMHEDLRDLARVTIAAEFIADLVANNRSIFKD